MAGLHYKVAPSVQRPRWGVGASLATLTLARSLGTRRCWLGLCLLHLSALSFQALSLSALIGPREPGLMRPKREVPRLAASQIPGSQTQ